MSMCAGERAILTASKTAILTALKTTILTTSKKATTKKTSRAKTRVKTCGDEDLVGDESKNKIRLERGIKP